MNIFYLHHDVEKCAQYHCDKHTIKMILESCQLLSTAHRLIDGQQYIRLSDTGRKTKAWKLENQTHNEFLYSATHINHPSAVWVREAESHYMWLAKLTKELCKEYTYRYGKVHKCERVGLVDFFVDNIPNKIKVNEAFVEPPQCMPDYCKVEGDAVTGYRNYYMKEKWRMLSWSGKIKSRSIPEWVMKETV